MPVSHVPHEDPLAVAPYQTMEGDDLRRWGVVGEWVLANGLGGFAMGSISGARTRRYHSLLTAAAQPPVDRICVLAGVDDQVVIGAGDLGEVGVPPSGDQTSVRLTLHHYEGARERSLYHALLERFERWPWAVRWTFRIPLGAGGEAVITKSITVAREINANRLEYRVVQSPQPVRFELSPLIALRDFHDLRRDMTGKADRARGGAIAASAPPPDTAAMPRSQLDADGSVAVTSGSHRAVLRFHGGEFVPVPRMWHGFEYMRDLDRGQDGIEDLYGPGVVEARLETGGTVAIDAAYGGAEYESPTSEPERFVSLGEATCRVAQAEAGSEDTTRLVRLAAAADKFVVRRTRRTGPMGTSVIAGYPWFADWGRDTTIALPGLMIATGRLEEAGQVLEIFGEHRKDGIIPNRFDDYGGEAYYNTVDASLWYVNAVDQFQRAGGDETLVRDALIPACLDILEHYEKGTVHKIRMEPDGLITAGDEETQLTWMDAKRDGVTFTARHGKAVEINALWHNGLMAIAEVIQAENPTRADHLAKTAAMCANAFNDLFWSHRLDCLHDHVAPVGAARWAPDRQIRPNQVFAVSLPRSPLLPEHRQSVVDKLMERLWTPVGVRTLDPEDPSYHARFRGPLFHRDRAYHNGTAWCWLAGPLAEGVLRAGGFSAASRKRARAILEPLIAMLDGPHPGSISEVFDAEGTDEDPQRPDGCAAQAWSVAEPLRVFSLLVNAEAST
ncbi:MAG: amylo-alpha-1,6-glucosidase [Planctomycetota bacterium]